MWTSIICLACLGLIMETQTFSCDPFQDCKFANSGDKVPDPNNCENFYFCVGIGSDVVPSNSPAACPFGQYFDQSTVMCQPELSLGICDNNPCEPLLCQSTCYKTLDLIVYQGDCSKYYICEEGTAVQISCPDFNPFFNGVACVADESKCCEFCSTYCYAQGAQVADPFDCTKFYVCFEVGPVQEKYHATCQSGSYFDFKSALCIDGSECTPMCSVKDTVINAINTSTAPTTSILPFCTDEFICIIDKNYPKCNYCDQSYFHCEGRTPTVQNCPEGFLFNIDPCYNYCVPANECPYTG